MTAASELRVDDAPTLPPHPVLRRRREAFSPFLDGGETSEGPTLDELVRAQHAERPLVVALLTDIDAVVERLRTPDALEAVARTGLLLCTAAVAIHAAGLVAPLGALAAARAAGLSVAAVLLGLAAALGPIYGTSVVVAARLPMARLVVVVLCAVASGAVVLAGLTPVVRLAFDLDPVWAGPLASVAAFGLMGVLTGMRMSRLLLALAEACAGGLTEGARFRVAILGRMALAFSALTTCLALWAFDALLVG